MPAPVSLTQALLGSDPDADRQPATALRLALAQRDVEQPLHVHRKGQLVLALQGGVSCEVPQALWMVPPHHAVWIPGGVPHSNRATENASIYFLFVEPGVAALPSSCCTLAISPLLRELILYLAGQPPDYPVGGPTARLVTVLLEHLAAASVEQLHLPTSGHPKLRRIAQALAEDPSDRSTLGEWAGRLAMSERTLARLVARETGLSFGRWRQQLHLVVALRELSAGAAVH